jgi:protein-disulfide isomerase
MTTLKPVIPEPEDTVQVRRSSLIPLIFLVIGFAAGLGIGYFTWGATATVKNPAVAVALPTAIPANTRLDIPVGTAPVWGPADAPVTIVEFSDYECAFCKKWHSETWIQLQQAYPQKIRLVYKDFPLYQAHPNASPAAKAARCANDQNKYWQFHDRIFNSNSLSSQVYEKIAQDLGLDLLKWKNCINSTQYDADITADYQYGAQLGINGTPTFFINGIRMVGAQPFSAFKQIIDQELARK